MSVLSVAILALLLGCACTDDLYAERNLDGEIYWHGARDQPRVALTFDDGPAEPYTSEVLDVLRRNHVRATFFLVGRRVEAAPAVARAIVAAGHAIGNHSYSHPHMRPEEAPEVTSEIERSEAAIRHATGVRPRLFRAPYGEVDPIIVLDAERLGYVTVQWSVAARDWLRPGAGAIVDRVLAQTHDGAIILLHDGPGDREQTVEALGIIIPALKARGYAFVTVPELLGLESPGRPRS